MHWNLFRIYLRAPWITFYFEFWNHFCVLPELFQDLNWPYLEWCVGSDLHTIEPPGPITALWSVPGSGNTWVRFLIHQATGYLTGALKSYNESLWSNNVLPGGHLYDGSAIAVKDHMLYLYVKHYSYQR